MNKVLTPTLYFDCSYIAYRCFYGMPRMEWGELDTTVMYGFFEHVFEAARTFQTTDFVFCFDSRSSKRKDLFPAYKKKRKELAEDEKEARQRLYDGLKVLRQHILPALGFLNVFYKEGYEADDLLHGLIMNRHIFDGRAIMVTGDEDMYQTLKFPGVSMYNFRKNYTVDDFRKEYGVSPDRWSLIKSITGCTSDEVPGIFKVGPSTAIKFIKGILSPSTKTYQSIISGRDVIHRNKKLVTLPFPGLTDDDLKMTRNIVTKEKVEKVARKYGFLSWLDSADWNYFFTGQRPKKKPRIRK